MNIYCLFLWLPLVYRWLSLLSSSIFFNGWQRPGPGLALAGAGLPNYKDEEMSLEEMAAKPLAASSDGGGNSSGKVNGEILITVDKPLGLTLKERRNGGIEVSSVNSGGNAAKAGIKSGDVVVYTSSFFGDELWPADKLAFTNSAISACPNSIDFIVVRGAGADQVSVKRLPKRPAPPKFGRKLTPAQKARATHICVDCGFIYALPTPFDDQPKNYRCPQCQATKSRFSKYDAESGRAIGSTALPDGILAGALIGAALVVILVYVAVSV